MSERENKWNPHEYNLKLIGEHNWKWNVTIVLRVKFSERHDLKRLNKDALKHIHQIGSQLYPKEIKGYQKSFLGVCTGEIQESSGLLHHHAILGELWKPNLWFNNSIADLQWSESREFRLKELDHRELLKERIQKKLEGSEFESTYLGKKLEIAKNPVVEIYQKEIESGGSWRGYIVKEDSNAYWSPYYHELVRKINQVNQENGVIPDELLHLKCWSKPRKDADFTTRLKLLLEQRGGDTNEK
jgi:hypothetical protein